MDEDWKNAISGGWKTQVQFSKAAEQAKAQIHRWRGPLILLSMLGACAAVVSHEFQAWFGSKPESGPLVVGLIGTLCLAFAAYLTKEVLSPKLELTWTRYRSIAEALKAECFRFALGVAPFTPDLDGIKKFNARVDELTKDTDFDLPIAVDVPDSDAKPQRKIDLAHYVKFRAEQQRDWLQVNGKKLNDQDVTWRWVSISLALISIAISALGSTLKLPGIIALVPIVTTAIASMTSYVVAMRFRATALLYNATAFQLNRLLANPRDASFPDKCESILLASNQSWMAEWSKQADGGSQPAAPIAGGGPGGK